MNEALPIAFSLHGVEFRLNDASPFYSQLYPERLVASSSTPSDPPTPALQPHFHLEMLKYRTVDVALEREFDVQMRLWHEPGLSLHYIHTHRFFCALLDFWWHFLDLMDQVYRQNTMQSSPAPSAAAALRTRCALDVDISAPCQLLLPLNQFSEEALSFACESLSLRNRFVYASQLNPEQFGLAVNPMDAAMEQSGGGVGGGVGVGAMRLVDCLVDEMRVECRAVDVRPVTQVSETK